MIKLERSALKKLILEAGLANNQELSEVDKIQQESGQPYEEILVNRKVINEKDLAMLYAKSINMPYADLEGKTIKRDLLVRIPERIASKYRAVIFGEEDGRLQVAMADPEDYLAAEFIEKQIGTRIKIFMASSSDISFALDQYREGLGQEITRAIKESELSKDVPVDSNITEEEMDIQSVADAPIAKAVNIIFGYAVKQRATDIHIEPRETFIQIRYRVDGILREVMSLPKNLLPPVISRLKILSNLKIDEHRLPQDGRIKVRVAGKTFGVRVSILPTIFGEKIVMRLLEESAKAASIDNLGFQFTNSEIINRAIKKPHGITFVTGPTGSGKTTTLYSIISSLNNPGVNISTIEDPVEYRIPGTNQVQLNTKAGLTFAVGLRALLRQDPNIIMIGEIRDMETLEIAIHAALTGHVVLTTLHTNSAAATIPRLLDMGAEPFLIASTVNAMLGQRLVRQLCDECKKPIAVEDAALAELKRSFDVDRALSFFKSGVAPQESSEEPVMDSAPHSRKMKVIPAPGKEKLGRRSILQRIADNPEIIEKSMEEAESERKSKKSSKDEQENAPTDNVKQSSNHITLFEAVGCGKCESGYMGRVGIFEAIESDNEVEKMVIQRASSNALQEYALTHQNMITMQTDGLIKCLKGITTIQEVLRVTKE